MNPTLKDFLARDKRITEAATKGPWKYKAGQLIGFLGQCFFSIVHDRDILVCPERIKLENADFIAHSRNTAEIKNEMIRVMAEALHEVVESWGDDDDWTCGEAGVHEECEVRDPTDENEGVRCDFHDYMKRTRDAITRVTALARTAMKEET